MIQIGNTNRVVLDQLHSIYGGSVHERPSKWQGPNGKESFQWMLSGQDIIGFVNDIYPYVKMKTAQLEIGRMLVTLMPGKGHKYPDRSRLEAEYLFARLGELNKRGR